MKSPGASTVDVRAEAARALARIVDGASQREVAADALGRIADPRDRALWTALVSEGARWWLRYAPAVDGLLARPLPKREGEARALLVLGLVQLEVLGVAPYAAVASTVEAMRALGRPRYAGLANAVLRRFGREREAILSRLDDAATTRCAMPTWLLDALQEDWPARVAAIVEAGNTPASLTLRVNRRVGSRAAYCRRLAESGLAAAPLEWSEDAVVLTESADVRSLPGFADGAFSVQDAAAQLAGQLLAATDGMRVLDACAAPGGKSCHLLERADVDLLALDSDASRLGRVGENLKRLGLDAALQKGDATTPADWWDGRKFDRILLDAPCSATGVIRRHPDIKLHRRAGDIPALVRQQGRMLAALWPLLATGGRLVYASCSLLRAENEQVVSAFLAGQEDAAVVTLDLPVGRAAGPGWQLLPGDDAADGMFYAVLEKHDGGARGPAAGGVRGN